MTGGRWNRRLGLGLFAVAVALAGAGGAATGLGAPAWLAGATAAVSALVAVVIADRAYASRERRKAARERRGLVLDPLRDARRPYPDERLSLLLPGRCLVPFRGREPERARLDAWCDGEPRCPVMMIAGPAGVGKSRLALEFASRLPAGWAAGWLRAGANAAVEAVQDCGGPAVILADDADGRTDLVPLLKALAERHEDPEVRVVLVTRSAQGLRSALAPKLDERHAWVITRAAQLNLGIIGSSDDEVRWFDEAMAAFATALHKRFPVLPHRFPAGSGGAEPFVILQGQALLAVLNQGQSSDDPRDLPPDELAAALMDHEQRRWRAMAGSWDWGSGTAPSQDVQGQAVAALALLGAETKPEAAEIVRRVPELGDALAERLAAVASWAAGLYPDEPGMAPRIRPDLAGEWFVVSQLTANPDLARSLRVAMNDQQAARALGFLARASDRVETASDLFKEFTAGDLPRLILAAALAAQTGNAGRRLLDPIIATQIAAAHEWTLDQLTALQDTLPSHLLLHTHVAIAKLIVTAVRALTADNPAAHQAGLAHALEKLSDSLGQVGRYREALETAEEAVTTWRALAADNPGRQAGLANVLNQLDRSLSRVGQYRQALGTAEEAVITWRALAADNPAHHAHHAGLAEALELLGGVLGQVRRNSEALEAVQEAVTIWRALAADDPVAHQPGLAHALMMLGFHLERVDRYGEALEAVQEAVTIWRALAADNPVAHQVGLAHALDNLGSHLSQVDRYGEALEAVQESVAVSRALDADNPAHQARLANALNNLGALLQCAGRYWKALEAVQESIAVSRALTADNPADQTSLASALFNLGVYLDREGRSAQALAACTESARICRDLARTDPGLYEHQYHERLADLQEFLSGMQYEALTHNLADQS